MKLFVFLFFAIILFGCSDVSNQSAFVGEGPKHETALVGTIPSESIYQLPDTFQTQDKKLVTLASFAGKPTIVGMIFTHCTYACPRLTADIKNIEQDLKSEKGKVNYLLVSFDSERDFPDQLKKFADASGLDKNWTLLHGSESAVRTLSVLLNVQFEKDAEGNFSHSNIISVLDKQGNLVFQKEGLGEDPNSTVSQINQMIASK
ncbi:MAG TPA: SCO family protein [Hanamia sp.]|nr:SCO family protein [Hanamia sp.]